MAQLENFNPDVDNPEKIEFPEGYEADDSATGDNRKAELPEGDQEQVWGAIHPGLFNKLSEEGNLPKEEI